MVQEKSLQKILKKKHSPFFINFKIFLVTELSKFRSLHFLFCRNPSYCTFLPLLGVTFSLCVTFIHCVSFLYTLFHRSSLQSAELWGISLARTLMLVPLFFLFIFRIRCMNFSHLSIPWVS